MCYIFSILTKSDMVQISKKRLLGFWESHTWELPFSREVFDSSSLPFLVFHVPNPDLHLVKIEISLIFSCLSILSPVPITYATASLDRYRKKWDSLPHPWGQCVEIVSCIWCMNSHHNMHLHGSYMLESHGNPQLGILHHNHKPFLRTMQLKSLRW